MTNGQDENITYEDFLDTCKTNGLLYVVIARQQLFPPFPKHTLPCRSVEDGRKMIADFEAEGIKGYFYIRKLSFSGDPWYTRLINWIHRYR